MDVSAGTCVWYVGGDPQFNISSVVLYIPARCSNWSLWDYFLQKWSTHIKNSPHTWIHWQGWRRRHKILQGVSLLAIRLGPFLCVFVTFQSMRITWYEGNVLWSATSKHHSEYVVSLSSLTKLVTCTHPVISGGFLSAVSPSKVWLHAFSCVAESSRTHCLVHHHLHIQAWDLNWFGYARPTDHQSLARSLHNYWWPVLVYISAAECTYKLLHLHAT